MRIRHSGIVFDDPQQSTPGYLMICPVDGDHALFSPQMGGVQRLPSGNPLICEGKKGCVFEVTNDGDVVREVVSPYFENSEMLGGINWLSKCRWFAENSPEIGSLSKAGLI